MDRVEKIDKIVEFLDDNHVKMIDTTNIGSVIIDAEQSLNKVEDEFEYNELLEKDLTDDDIESFKKFLEKNTLMMIKVDEISGVSFENSEYDADNLYETDLFNDNVEEDENLEQGRITMGMSKDEAQGIANEVLRAITTNPDFYNLKALIGRELDITDETLDEAVKKLFSKNEIVQFI